MRWVGDPMRTPSAGNNVKLRAAGGRVPERHPERTIRVMVDQALASWSTEFEALHAHRLHPLIRLGYVLRATFSQIRYSMRYERLLVKQSDYYRLFRRFIGLSMDAAVW